MWPSPQEPIQIDPHLFDWQSMTDREVEEAYLLHGNKSLTEALRKLGMLRVIEWAMGDTVIASNGGNYWNFQGGYGSTPFGGDIDFITEAIWGDQILDRPAGFANHANIIHAALTKPQACLLRLLATIAPGDISRFQFYNSGTEAVDNLIQSVWFASGIGPIITMEHAYHGKSGLTRLCTPSGHFMKGFEGLELSFAGLLKKKRLFMQVPYGDVPALERAIREHKPKAVLLEPVQGEAGGIRPPKGFLRSVEEICHKNGVLVLYDEVQVGFGRTGKLFGCQLDADKNWQPQPDGMSMAKALGGGHSAIAAIGLTDKIFKDAYKGPEGMLRISTTFGGNANACIAGINSIRRILAENLPKAAAEAGAYIMKKLEPLKSHHLINDISGAGLLIGVRFNVPLPGQQAAEAAVILIASEMVKRGVIPVVSLVGARMRFEPPLNVSKEAIDAAASAFKEVLDLYPTPLSFATAIGKAGYKLLS